MILPRIMPATDHGSEIGLLAIIAAGTLILLGLGLYTASKNGTQFDPSAYLVVLTLIVGAIKERWLSRSVDRMGQNLANAPPTADPNAPSGTPEDPLNIQGVPAAEPVTTTPARK